MISFNISASTQAVGPWSPVGLAQVTLVASSGDCVVVAVGGSLGGCAYPSSVTDDHGNNYVLYSQSAGQASNVPYVSFIYVATNVSGGTLLISVNGWTAGSSDWLGDGISVIAATVECTEPIYQIWGMGLSEIPGPFYTGEYSYLCSQQNSSYSAADSTVQFRSVVTNGILGGSTSSDTGTCQLVMLPGNPPRSASATCGVAFVVDYEDVFMIGVNYDPNCAGRGSSGPATWTITTTSSLPLSTPTNELINQTFEPSSSEFDVPASLVMAYGDFPYIPAVPPIPPVSNVVNEAYYARS